MIAFPFARCFAKTASLVFLLCQFCFAIKAQTIGSRQISVSLGTAGDTTDVKTKTLPGIVLMGGSTDVDAAFQWMIQRSGGGDFVVIRASGSTGYNDYIKSLGNVNSVETLLIDSREKANFAETALKIRNAEALFIAGGDQGNYVKYWTGTEVSKAIQYLIDEKRVPIGGTSAGCAVLSGYVFDAKTGGVTSEQALKNPYDTLVSLSKSFISLPVLKNSIADQHYAPRKRQGRHVVFMARLMKDFNPVPLMGIGVDEKTAVLVEEDGRSTVVGSGSAWFLYPTSTAERCEPGRTLTWNHDGKALRVFKRTGTKNGTEGLNLLTIPSAAPDQHWFVVDGILTMR